MIRFCSLFSGSSGNCIFIGTEDVSLLVDAGVSASRISDALIGIGERPESLAGIFITHEHSDHIMGAGILSRRYDIPIYANPGTWNAMTRSLGKIKDHNIGVIEKGVPFLLGSVELMGYSIPHDAADPMAYLFQADGHKVAVATDIGVITDEIRTRLQGSDLILIESNHDVQMLMTGRYPWPLKKRILSEHGHLSNACAADFVTEMALGGTTRFFLGHLSKENNLPEIAYNAVKELLIERGLIVGKDIFLTVASRDCSSEVVRIS